MAELSSPVIQIDNGDITVDAALVASKLGLTIEALKENMANGLVMSVAETGKDEDAGRTRLTFRYRARVWRVVVEADGSLLEDPLPNVDAKPAIAPFSLRDLVKGAS